MSTLLKSDQWQQALQYCSDPHDYKDTETPVRKLIKKMPGQLTIQTETGEHVSQASIFFFIQSEKSLGMRLESMYTCYS